MCMVMDTVDKAEECGDKCWRNMELRTRAAIESIAEGGWTSVDCA